jgi:hypothetical protein
MRNLGTWFGRLTLEYMEIIPYKLPYDLASSVHLISQPGGLSGNFAA